MPSSSRRGKLWDAHKRHAVPAPEDVQWQLLAKAEQGEAMFEALLVKVTSEKTVSDSECDRLAGFRQGYQTLRECIRADKPLEWWASEDMHPGPGYTAYRAFKILAEHFATLLHTAGVDSRSHPGVNRQPTKRLRR
jgi:hypothetical protein